MSTQDVVRRIEEALDRCSARDFLSRNTNKIAKTIYGELARGAGGSKGLAAENRRLRQRVRQLQTEIQETDMLRSIFALQQQFDEHVAREHDMSHITGHVPQSDGAATIEAGAHIQDRWVQVEVMAMFAELAEILELTSCKWWKEPVTLDKAAITEELVDLLHFFVSTCLRLGLDAEQIYETYRNKNSENYRRQEEEPGYKVQRIAAKARAKEGVRCGTT